jgi:hypothetical protein
MGPGDASTGHRYPRGSDCAPLLLGPVGRYVVVYLLRGIIEVCHTRLLLANVFDIFHTAAHPDPICLLCWLDYRESTSSLHHDLSALTDLGNIDLYAVPTNQ